MALSLAQAKRRYNRDELARDRNSSRPLAREPTHLAPAQLGEAAAAPPHPAQGGCGVARGETLVAD
jgi:hypothetical protein